MLHKFQRSRIIWEIKDWKLNKKSISKYSKSSLAIFDVPNISDVVDKFASIRT